MTTANRDALLSSLPAEWPEDLLPSIQARVTASERKIVVLDDDPTGTQTVHSVPVLTGWSTKQLELELTAPGSCCYLLTNSRSLPGHAAQALNTEIGQNLCAAAQATGREVAVVSRSDSTLRGHFPDEVNALAAALGGDFDAYLIVPFFLEGGRYTISDVHYVADGDRLVPAALTPYARDGVFGYQSSDLRQWVAEKTAGRFAADEVASISLDDLRRDGPERVAERLLSLPRGAICIVNAASYRDLEVFVLGLLAAEQAGRRYLYRTAASFVRVRAGIAPQPLLDAPALGLDGANGGLFVIGSHVPTTTRQYDALVVQPGLLRVEIDVHDLLDDSRRETAIAQAAAQADAAIGAGQDAVLATSRTLVAGHSADDNLNIGQRISSGLIAIVQRIKNPPRYLVAKGGITSSDVATQALGVRKALVLGQILPGVPVWQLGPEARYPGAPYIVFPGNVGGPDALAEIRCALHNAPEV